MSERKWVRSSLRHLQERLEAQVSHTTIGRLLRAMDYSLKVNVKRLTGDPHPDRDQQFTYLESQKQAFLQAGWPVISVDSKKKELIGNFKNAGQRWCLEADLVNEHDFKQDALGKAVPYGLYNLNHNLGYVYVGQSADTPQFAVEVIAEWWQTIGRELFPTAPQLLILGDAGGSNGYRPRMWKEQLQEQLADHLGLEVTVCHYPTGASKWNPVDHRLFSEITKNWAGRPLDSFETLLAYASSTRTRTGLEVTARLVDRPYPKGIRFSRAQMRDLDIEPHLVQPKRNYTIYPRV